MRNYSKGDHITARGNDGLIYKGIYERTSTDARGNIMVWAYWNGRTTLQWMSVEKIIATIDYKVDQEPLEDEEVL
ncbi:hypothetical protein SmphiM6_88 [Sinorhizobium phage phiM6]|nr:hypothetical protein SmphiM6_88 [Sinorhizobium phage phiM6]